MFKVKISETYSGVEWNFKNFDDAMNFIGMAIEYGAYNDQKLTASIQEVDEGWQN